MEFDIGEMVESAKVMDKGIYFEPGMYTLKVRECKPITKKNGQRMACVSFSVVESSNTQIPAGAVIDWIITFRYEDSDARDIKSFIVAASDAPPETVNRKVVNLVFSPENVLKGKVVKCHAYRNEGKQFVKKTWISASGS